MTQLVMAQLWDEIYIPQHKEQDQVMKLQPAAAKPTSTTATQQAASSKPKMVATYNVTAKKR